MVAEISLDLITPVFIDLSTAVVLDTSLIVAATVEAHPSHVPATRFVDDLVSESSQLCISPQICREFLVVLTRQPVSNRLFTVEEAMTALDVWATGCLLLEETLAVVQECVSLVRRHGVLGKQIHDCNLVATMRAHGVQRLATRNPADFKRFHAEISVLSVPG
jgi:predicted nucleic acid-binding protein